MLQKAVFDFKLIVSLTFELHALNTEPCFINDAINCLLPQIGFILQPELRFSCTNLELRLQYTSDLRSHIMTSLMKQGSGQIKLKFALSMSVSPLVFIFWTWMSEHRKIRSRIYWY